MKNVLVGTPNHNFASELKKQIEGTGDYRVYDTIVSEEDLFQVINKANEDGIALQGLILQSNLAKKFEDKRLDWLADILLTLKQEHPEIAITILVDEKEGHPFLAELVQIGIWNIFTPGKKYSISGILNSLSTPFTFSDVAHLRNIDPLIPWRKINRGPQAFLIPEKEEENKKKSHNPKIIEKKSVTKVVEQKVINKQIIKKQYRINITNQVEEYIGMNIERKLILVSSPFSGTGCTFFAHHLSKLISDKGVGVTYIENPFTPGYTYDRFYGKKNSADEYISLFKAFARDSQNNDLGLNITADDLMKVENPTHYWEQEGVRLIALNPLRESQYSEMQLDLMAFTKILLTLQKTPYVILDIGTDMEKEVYKELATLADHSFVIVGPDIPKREQLFTQQRFPGKLHQHSESSNIETVCNQSTKKITDNLFQEDVYVIPQLPSEEVFLAQYNGSFQLQGREVTKKLHSAFAPILERILPEKFMNGAVNHKGKPLRGFFKTLRNINITEVKGD
ncbi:hypothetical protein [Peribacillus loiseleuriae]|uniref:hypothetical protein n=1 Tax=Peribacillus loiseleuriae TaxID=1679170 RepID=UPI003CFCEA21